MQIELSVNLHEYTITTHSSRGFVLLVCSSVSGFSHFSHRKGWVLLPPPLFPRRKYLSTVPCDKKRQMNGMAALTDCSSDAVEVWNLTNFGCIRLWRLRICVRVTFRHQLVKIFSEPFSIVCIPQIQLSTDRAVSQLSKHCAEPSTTSPIRLHKASFYPTFMNHIFRVNRRI